MKTLAKIKYTIQALIVVVFVIKFLEKVNMLRKWDYELDNLLKKFNL